jgi:hypothetical protein
MKLARKTAALGGAVALVICAAATQAQELLTNANLDATAIGPQVLATPTSWQVSANTTLLGPFNDGASSESFCNVADAGGKGLFFKPFAGNATRGPITVDFFQDVPGTPGLQYVMTGWAGAGPGYIGLTDPTVDSEFRLTFLNGSSIPIGGSVLDLQAAGLGNPPGGPFGFGYKQFNLTATAPAGTAFVRVHARMANAFPNPLGGDQAFVVDAFSLQVPEPGSIALIGLGGGMLMLRRRG